MVILDAKESTLNIYEKKLKRQNIPKFDEFIMKVNIECFSRNNLLQRFELMKNVVKIVIYIYMYIYIYIYI